MASVVALWKRLKEATIKFSPTSKGVGFILRPDEIRSATQRLARELNIVGKDYKSNLLLLRIKIEEQLRELANKADIPFHLKLQSPTSLTNRLADRGILPGTIAKGIADVLPVINRELHASEAYLAKNEFENLQQFTLQLVAELILLNRQKETGNKTTDTHDA